MYVWMYIIYIYILIYILLYIIYIYCIYNIYIYTHVFTDIIHIGLQSHSYHMQLMATAVCIQFWWRKTDRHGVTGPRSPGKSCRPWVAGISCGDRVPHQNSLLHNLHKSIFNSIKDTGSFSFIMFLSHHFTRFILWALQLTHTHPHMQSLALQVLGSNWPLFNFPPSARLPGEGL